MPLFSVRRAALLMATGVVAFGALAGRVGYLQTYGREETVRTAERQQHREQGLPARRGCVFDRNGLLMAGTLQSKVLFVDVKFMLEEFTRAADVENKKRADQERARAKGKKPATPATPGAEVEKGLDEFPKRYAPWDGLEPAVTKAVTDVAELIYRDPAELMRTVLVRQQDRFLKLALRVDDQTAEAIAKLKIPGVGFQPMPVRAYPMDDLASHVLGGISGDGVGIDGLEARYEKVLRGRDGFLREQTDSRGRPIAVTADDYVAPTHGRHLVLTIDSNIQLIAEQELRATVKEFNAKAGEVVVMDPWTGEILALANWPTYRPAEYLESPAVNRTNRALVSPYEPGSTIKPFCVAPWLDEKDVRVGEVIDTHDGKYRTPYGRPVTDVHAYPRLTVWDVLVKSSNIGMAMMGERVGNAKIRGALERFDFGKPTGVELPGETGGRLNPLKKWTKYSTESIVQGYEVMVTPLQLARGMSAIANGGKLVRPTVVRGVVEGQGTVGALASSAPAAQKAASREDRIAISPQTAADVRRVLADVLVRGTGTRARSDTYNIFGKTGTAHLVDPKTKRYSEDRYTSSFIGGAPYEHPRLVVAFVIHEAEKKGKNYYGGTTAAPGAAMVLERSLRYLGVEASPKLDVPGAMAGTLYNFDAKKYADWPENVRKERARDGALPGRSTTRPTMEWGVPVVPIDPSDLDDDAAPSDKPTDQPPDAGQAVGSAR